MNDIVKQLHEYAINAPTGFRVYHDAANEIIYLRAENAKLSARAVLIPESVEKIIDDYPAICAERDRMREALKPFSERMKLLEKCKNAAKYGVSTDIDIEHLRRAKEVYENTK